MNLQNIGGASATNTHQGNGEQLGAVDLFNEVFSQLRVIFPALNATIKTRQALDDMRRQWVRAFAEQGIHSNQQIQAGLCIAREQQSPFAPSPGQFVEWCGQGLARLWQLPDEQTLMREFRTYCARRGGYPSAEDYPFSSDALYWLVTTLYDAMQAERLDPTGVERKGKALLVEMARGLAEGITVRKPVRRLSKPRDGGPTPAQQLHAEYQRRKASGLC